MYQFCPATVYKELNEVFTKMRLDELQWLYTFQLPLMQKCTLLVSPPSCLRCAIVQIIVSCTNCEQIKILSATKFTDVDWPAQTPSSVSEKEPFAPHLTALWRSFGSEVLKLYPVLHVYTTNCPNFACRALLTEFVGAFGGSRQTIAEETQIVRILPAALSTMVKGKKKDL